MSRRTQLFSLLGGCFLVLFGLVRLYKEGDLVLLILGLLIVAFTVSNIARTTLGKEDGNSEQR